MAGRVHRYFMFVVLLKSDLVKYKFYDLHTNLMCIIIKIQNKIAIIYSVIFEMGVVLISYNGVAYLLSFEKSTRTSNVSIVKFKNWRFLCCPLKKYIFFEDIYMEFID